MPYGRILVATDLSESAREAARLALRLGGDRARHLVVHVAPAPTLLDPGGAPSEALDRAQARLLAEAEAWAQAAGLRDAEAYVPVGGVGREVAREASRLDADLVVVGHRGQSPIERLLLGSSARGVLRAAPVDVLVARGPAPGADEPPFRSILVATDFQPPSARAAARALMLAEEHGASLSLVHVVDPSVWYDAMRDAPDAGGRTRVEAAQTRLADFAREHLRGRAAAVVLRGRPAHEVARHAAAKGHDLVVIGTHGAGALERAMLGSAAEAIVERAPCSVLLVR